MIVNNKYYSQLFDNEMGNNLKSSRTHLKFKTKHREILSVLDSETFRSQLNNMSEHYKNITPRILCT